MVARRPPGISAIACITGGPLAPQLNGVVYIQDVPGGTWVSAEIKGLPPYQPGQFGKAPIGPHGFHIHEIGVCEVGDQTNSFQSAGEHWNPTNQPHGNHAGDFPVLFSNNGYARIDFFTNRFRVANVIDRSVIIHQSPVDYRTQPAGKSGKRLACGIILQAGHAGYPSFISLTACKD
jgi:Cu-Zn family superoxide dismutase